MLSSLQELIPKLFFLVGNVCVDDGNLKPSVQA